MREPSYHEIDPKDYREEEEEDAFYDRDDDDRPLRNSTDSPQLGVSSPSPQLRGGGDPALFLDHLNLDGERRTGLDPHESQDDEDEDDERELHRRRTYDDGNQLDLGIDLGSPERSTTRRRVPLGRLRTMHREYVSGMGSLLEDYEDLASRHSRLSEMYLSKCNDLEEAKRTIVQLERHLTETSSVSAFR